MFWCCNSLSNLVMWSLLEATKVNVPEETEPDLEERG